MNPEQWLSLKWNGGSTMSDRWLNQSKIIHVLEKMENGEFESIKHKRWEKKIREVYFYKHNRIFYITVDGNDIYLLHACKKQKNKTEKKDSKIVKKRAKELGKELGKTFI